MGKFVDCLVETGIFSKKDAEKLLTERPELDFDGIQQMKWLSEHEQELIQKVRVAKLQAVATDRVLRYIDGYGGKKENSLFSLLVKIGEDQGGAVDVESRGLLGIAESHGRILDAMEKYKARYLGFARDPEATRNLAFEILGKTTGDHDAAQYARMISQEFERLRTRFNELGGRINKKETGVGWFPSTHDPAKMMKDGAEAWKDTVRPLVDWHAMGYIEPEKIESALDAVFNSIVTDGRADIEPGKLPKGATSMMANRHSQHRFFEWKDPDSWMQYQDKYGAGDLFDPVLQHIDTMNKEMAMMEVFGPNPDNVFKHAVDYLRSNNPMDANIANRSEELFANLTNKTFAKNREWAQRMSTARNLVASAKLPFATIASLGDLASVGTTSVFDGIPVMRMYLSALSQLNPARHKADKLLVAKIGLGADFAAGSLQTMNRYAELVGGHKLSRKLASWTIKASGLEAWTDTLKMVFRKEYSSTLAQYVGKPFDKMDGALRKSMERYGVTADDWARITAEHVFKDGGVKHLDIMNLPPDLKTKIGGGIMAETQYGIQDATARVRSWGLGKTQAGTREGEVMRSVFLFKNFPTAVFMTHWDRALHSKDFGGAMGRIGYLGGFLLGTTMLGTLSYQAKQMLRGWEPIDWQKNPGALLTQGFLQGGGGGLLGDFLFSDANRFGGSLAGTLAGPLVGEAETIGTRGILENIRQAVKGQETHAGAELTKILEDHVPVPWWGDLAAQRLLFDSINRMMDPDFGMKMRRLERQRYNETGQRPWWPAGDMTPGG